MNAVCLHRERRHDNVARFVHWRLYEKYKLDRTNKLYDHKQQGVIENVDYKILQDAMIQCDKKIDLRVLWQLVVARTHTNHSETTKILSFEMSYDKHDDVDDDGDGDGDGDGDDDDNKVLIKF